MISSVFVKIWTKSTDFMIKVAKKQRIKPKGEKRNSLNFKEFGWKMFSDDEGNDPATSGYYLSSTKELTFSVHHYYRTYLPIAKTPSFY